MDISGTGNRVQRVKAIANTYGGVSMGGVRNELRESQQFGNVQDGVVLRGVAASDNTVIFDTASNNGRYGVFFAGANRGTLRNSRMDANGVRGVQMVGASNATVAYNVVSSNGNDGLQVNSSRDSSFVANEVSSNRAYGFNLEVSDGMTLINNRATRNAFNGFFDTRGSNQTYRGNRAQLNLVGLQLDVPQGAATLQNNITGSVSSLSGGTGGNRGEGLAVTGVSPGPGATIVISGNSANGNGHDGIVVFGVTTLMTQNTASHNGDDGIDHPFGPATLTANYAGFNRSFGIRAAPGDIDGGGNRANRNVAGQCLNVSC